MKTSASILILLGLAATASAKQLTFSGRSLAQARQIVEGEVSETDPVSDPSANELCPDEPATGGTIIRDFGDSFASDATGNLYEALDMNDKICDN
jgi:hypothetical protein